MPQPFLPPTPGSSTDIKGKDGAQQLSSIHAAFELPPPAIHDASRTCPTDSKAVSSSQAVPHPPTFSSSSPRTTYPLQAAETVKSRRRSSSAKGNSGDNDTCSFALPPPPTRSRKIIQMKPRMHEGTAASAKDSGRTGGKGSAGSAKSATNKSSGAADTSATQAKKQQKQQQQQQQQQQPPQPSATSAAGRRIARKTAHSLIERRRRSKMNEEFAVLKSMIPACTGEMHKLAILQASIDYVRYLEDCIAKLKAQHGDHQNRDRAGQSFLPRVRAYHPTSHMDPSGDVDMSDPGTASPLFPGHPDHLHGLSLSPGSRPEDARHRQQSFSSASTDQRHNSISASAGASPAFGPRWHGRAPQTSGSTLTSPALHPQSDLDQEATAALLMLNSDRRGTNPSLYARGLSVRDLLST
ncbi:uncharacterized protein UV8b_02377 [Ustilaginoidea virens]|uniref:BHLH domain-containing protein n=1 Tax=Ustilaginoidea virens TaxID=1159556 RepID=A0A8E5MFM8_USTVR|nr:uncharacterized protein UV8b_02377 [Ustilaginoidea virens]QUC18136.1 hypothetical protein UV8b_02377 [Ustilaginoidea virens]